MSDALTRLNAALEGRYDIERELGAGGMATVYLAQDLRHNRQVALKVLKPELAALVGGERFLAEIETTANLQHPHILPLFDSGEADGFLFYVMPYVGGESLRERLDREHQLPVDEAVRMVTNVAEALDYAHSKGVIHRDIKPANVLLQAGKPVISDFGIALAVSAGGADRLTETGLSLGTPHYMSPEQATGDLSVGAATDIYALACVLYEMLVGEPPYTGSTPQAILGKIIAGELASPAKYRRSVPGNVEAAISKALERVPADRFANAADFAGALGDPGFRHTGIQAPGWGAASRRWRPIAIGSASVAALLAFWVAGLLRPGSLVTADSELGGFPALPARFQVTLPPEVSLPMNTGLPVITISPDGSHLVFVGERDGLRQLYRRSWTDSEAQPIADTEGAGGPSFSSDGAWIFFIQGQMLRRMPVAGGAAVPIQAITPIGVNHGVAVVGDSLVVTSPSSNGPLALAPINEDSVGGFDFLQMEFTEAGVPTASPAAVADEPKVLFTQTLGVGDTRAALVSIPSGEVQVLVNGASSARYSRTGRLLFTRGGTLFSAPFDPADGDVGPEQEVLDGVMAESYGSAHFAVSAGILAYVAGGPVSTERELVWVSRSGEVEAVLHGGREYVTPRLSPDEMSLVVSILEGANLDLHVLDLARSTLARRTTHPGEDFDPTWSPDGSTLAFASEIAEDRGEIGPTMAWMPMNAEQPEQLFSSPEGGSWEFPGSWSPDASWIAFTRRRDGRSADLFLLPTAEPREPVAFVETPAEERAPMFSPDGARIAYVSDVSGEDQVYVRPFPGPGPGTPISRDGGTEPMWSKDGRELFFRSGNSMMVVEMDPDAGPPRELFSAPFERRNYGGEFANYDVSRDGSRFLMVRTRNTVSPDVIQVIVGWPSLLLEAEGR